MPRRPHTKSRRGCLECKRRHVKCDEKKPVCTNCTTSERRCEWYSEWHTTVTAQTTRSASREHATPPSADSPLPSNFPEVPQMNMLHLELLYNLSSTEKTATSFGLISAMRGLSLEELLQHSLSAPYLINEILALSALHLSIVKPEQRALYRHHSTTLQNHALSLFGDISSSSQISDQNCVPAFLFSSILGFHMLIETLVFRETGTTFEQFLDRFVQYLLVHRGVRTVSSEGRWEILHQTTLGPFLKFWEKILRLETSPPHYCTFLRSRIEALGMDEATTSICTNTVTALQRVQGVIQASKQSSDVNSISALVAWPVLVPVEYINLVSQRGEAALVILAHYGALLHLHRESWMFGDSGEYLIKSISQHLGEEWEECLEWPRQVLTGSQLSDGADLIQNVMGE